MLALANVASAATGSGEDQYVEQVPQGGGTNKGTDETTGTLGGQNGTVTEQDVSDAAKKNRKTRKNKKKDKTDEGPTGETGGTGAVGGGGSPPTQAVTSAATAAKIGPFSRNTALLLGAMVLAIGGAAAVMHLRKPAVPGAS
jgi:hypothetical protein